MKKTWECWTLSSEEIKHVFSELYPGAVALTEDEMECVAKNFKEAVAALVEDWEDVLKTSIQIEVSRPGSLPEVQVLRLEYPDIFNYLDSGVFDEEDVTHIRTDEVALERIMKVYQGWRETCSYGDAMYEAIDGEVRGYEVR